jgi:DNA-binding transcriptional ArsR family regulator
MDISELLLHPVRLRIVQAAWDGLPFTTSRLCERLPDVSKATVYRQVALLAEGGLVEVEREERVRGAVERTYRLHSARTAMDLDTMAAMSIDDHHRGFAAAIAALLAEFNVYLGREGADPLADSVSYRQFPLWLSDAEKTEFLEELVAAIRARIDHGPSPERRRHLLSTILFPTDVSP